MKQTEWNEGMNHLDSDLVERYVEKKDQLLRRGRAAKKTWLRVGIVAACFLILVSAALTVPMPQKDPYMDPYFPSGDAWVPIIDSNVKDTILRADEVGNALRNTDSFGTNQYTKVYAPSPEYLGLIPLPNAEYLPIYSINQSTPSESELDSFVQNYLDAATSFFGIGANEYELEKGEFLDSDTYYAAKVEDRDTGSYKAIYFNTRENSLYLSYYNSHESRLTLNGSMVSILKTDTDEQIREKLQDTIDYVCASFGMEYTEIKICRHYSSDNRVMSFVIYLYSPEEANFPSNFSSHPMSQDYISLAFCTPWDNGSNYYNWEGNKEEAFLCRFLLNRATTAWSEYYHIDAKSKMLTLEEAEQLLEKGYVFGGHSCPLCMAKQPEVDFTDYTCVGFEYVADSKGRILVPFYTFYKYIGENYNGETTFAKTYVPAVQVEGLEEYFQMQTAQHPSGK